jgi:hypothetical protein
MSYQRFGRTSCSPTPSPWRLQLTQDPALTTGSFALLTGMVLDQ